jgi:IS30 family transposase
VHYLQHRIPIAERPAPANARAEAGHWEADLMLFRTSGQAVLVVHERLSRIVRVRRQPSKAAAPVRDSLAAVFRRLPKALRRSITFDNGSEFVLHHQIAARFNLKTFFCDPHAPWQKGGVENAIGRLRRPLPRKSDLDAITRRYNSTPRKCLDFKTPEEVFKAISTGVALQT